MEMFIKLETKTKSVKTKFNLIMGCCQSWWNLPEKNKKQKRLKEGQCLNMDGKLFKTTYQQKRKKFKRHED
jgi:hypothetical protein